MPVGPASAAPSNQSYTPAPAGYRRPRGFLKINGKSIALLSLSTSNTTAFSASSWEAELNTLNQPQGADLNFFEGLAPSATVSVCYGELTKNQAANEFPKAGNYIIVMVGLIDDLAFDRRTGTTHLRGRDLLARVIDAKTANKYSNLNRLGRSDGDSEAVRFYAPGHEDHARNWEILRQHLRGHEWCCTLLGSDYSLG